jgi:uncharacterized peroxidase-related enzyme
MAHIQLPEGLPGISGPLAAYPETAVHLRGLADALLRATESLTPAERELIATAVSTGNQCRFCAQSHAAVARQHLGENADLADAILAGNATVSPKLAALLAIAEKVRNDGRSVESDDIARARAAGADDRAIHDTVLIAAAFSMYNRYVEGLATHAPEDRAVYDAMGARLAEQGYRV